MPRKPAFDLADPHTDNRETISVKNTDFPVSSIHCSSNLYTTCTQTDFFRSEEELLQLEKSELLGMIRNAQNALKDIFLHSEEHQNSKYDVEISGISNGVSPLSNQKTCPSKCLRYKNALSILLDDLLQNGRTNLCHKVEEILKN